MTLRVVVLHSEHGVRVHDVPPARDLAEGEQYEGTLLVFQDTSGHEVVDLLAERRDGLAPAFAGPLLEQLDHLRGVLVDLGSLQSECDDEEVEHLAALDGLLVLVRLAERVDENGIDSFDIHQVLPFSWERYYYSINNKNINFKGCVVSHTMYFI